MSLAKFQENFIKYIYNSDENEILENIINTENLSIFANNNFYNLLDNLTNIYVCVREVVGSGFFKTIAKFYIENHPLKTGNRNEYGEHMPKFLTNFEYAKELYYLPEIAKIEWEFFRLNLSEKINLNITIQLKYNSFEVWQNIIANKTNNLEIKENPTILTLTRDKNFNINFKLKTIK